MANKALNRFVLNNGWTRSRPLWDKDVVVLTGGAKGIGKEVVKLLAARHAKLAVLDIAIPQDKIDGVRYFKCDVSSAAEVGQIAMQIRSELGEPSVIISNAGIARNMCLLEYSDVAFSRLLSINVVAAHILMREFLPTMIKQNRGHFQMTASAAAYVGLPQSGDYAASKAAVLGLYESLSAELKYRYNAPLVRTSLVCPGKVNTEFGSLMKDASNTFLTPTLQPEYLARRMVEQIESGLSGIIIEPAFSKVLLPCLRAAPDWFRALVLKDTNYAFTEDSKNAPSN